MSDAGNYVLSWDQHEENRSSTLKTLWENEDFLDVTIACDDDQIDAHKVILSAASPFFHKILKRNPHSHPLIYLRGTAKKDVQSLLDFIYSGETQVLQEELEGFMALASSLEVKGLVGGEFGDEKPDYSLIKPEVRKRRPKHKQHERKKNIKKEVVNIETTQEICIVETDIPDPEVNVEPSQKIGKIDSEDISEQVINYGITEDSFIKQNSPNISMTEYDEKLSELMLKTENSWGCRECSYSSGNKGHLREHVETHIEGFSHDCKSCDKTFKTRKGLRNHVYSRHSSINR